MSEGSEGRETQQPGNRLVIEPGQHTDRSLGRKVRDEITAGNPFAHVWIRPDRMENLPFMLPSVKSEFQVPNDLMIGRIKASLAVDESRPALFVPDGLPSKSTSPYLPWAYLPAAPREMGRESVTVLGTDLFAGDETAIALGDDFASKLQTDFELRSGLEGALHDAEFMGVVSVATIAETALIVAGNKVVDKIKLPRTDSRRAFLKLGGLTVAAAGLVATGYKASRSQVAGERAKMADTVAKKDYWLEVASSNKSFFETHWVDGRTALWIAKTQDYLANTGVNYLAIAPCGEVHVRNAVAMQNDEGLRNEAIAKLCRGVAKIVRDRGESLGLSSDQILSAQVAVGRMISSYTAYDVKDPGMERLPSDFLTNRDYIALKDSKEVPAIWDIYRKSLQEI